MEMKEFNLQEAKAGKPVCTRDGRNARIICFDAKREHCPIVALIDDGDKEYVASYCADGRFIYNHRVEHSVDLFMAPEKHVGWGWASRLSPCSIVSMFAQIYETEEEALSHKPGRSECFLAKVEWEE